jgi:NAD+ synthase
MTKKKFSEDIIKIDPAAEVERICKKMRHLLGRLLNRRGLVVGVSGGVDSSVTLGLAAKALGPNRVLALMMPERHSAEDTLSLSQLAADHFGCQPITEDITGTLEAVGHYRRYDEAVRQIVPQYGEGWKSKIITANAENKGLTFFYIIAERPDKSILKERLPHGPYLEIVAATNFKQRIRKMLEYYHADRLNFAVCGTPNRLEYDQGFFVKNGDGAADIKPIAHLYKTQVYQLAAYLGVPAAICNRPPTTDTYSLPQGQDEFYFSLPYDQMDLCLYAKNNGVAVEEVAAVIKLTPEQIQAIFDDIGRKRSTTQYLHLPALLVEDIPEIKY